jgi:hypothetical protein
MARPFPAQVWKVSHGQRNSPAKLGGHFRVEAPPGLDGERLDRASPWEDRCPQSQIRASTAAHRAAHTGLSRVAYIFRVSAPTASPESQGETQTISSPLNLG